MKNLAVMLPLSSLTVSLRKGQARERGGGGQWSDKREPFEAKTRELKQWLVRGRDRAEGTPERRWLWRSGGKRKGEYRTGELGESHCWRPLLARGPFHTVKPFRGEGKFPDPSIPCASFHLWYMKTELTLFPVDHTDLNFNRSKRVCKILWIHKYLNLSRNWYALQCNPWWHGTWPK